jgi:membrane-bound metal-dependent hydrolase YbcI (DUF457 family)
MLGHTHAITGVTAWLAVTPVIDATAGLTYGEIGLGAALAAGAAMIPDLDCPGSTICRTYGPITNLPSRVISWFARGHRKGTHSLLGISVFTAAAWWCQALGGWPQAVLLWILLGVAARGLGIAVPRHQSLTAFVHCVTMAGVTALVLSSGLETGTVLPWAMGIGCAAHIAGDMLTEEGCPLLWPLSRSPFGLRVIETGGWVERVIAGAAFVAAVVLAALLTPADVYIIATWRALT